GLPGSGYNTVTWMIYFYENFGIDLWKEVWEFMADRNIYDIAEALSEYITEPDFNSHFIKSYLWHFASGELAPAGEYGFEEKNEYPNINIDWSSPNVPVEEIDVDYL